MTRAEAHNILEECLKHGERIQLYGNIAFTIHFQAGSLRQITDTTHDGEKSLTKTSLGKKTNGE